MTAQYGIVLEVSTVNVGEYLAADASAAATSIVVNDSRVFNETGGILTLGDEEYDYTAVNPDTNTITLARGLDAAALADDRVELYPPAPVKTALVDLMIEGGEAVRATVPNTLVAVLADGMRADGEGEAVLLEERRPGELYVKDIPARADVPVERLQSLTYAEGTSGFRVDETSAQFQNMSVVEELGVDTVTARTMTINGIDLETEWLDPIGGRALAHDVSDTGINTANIGATETKVWEFAAGPVTLGKIYRLWVLGAVVSNAVDQSFDFRIRYTLDGSTPTTSSTLHRTFRLATPAIGNGYGLEFHAPFVPVSAENLKLAITMQRTAGASDGYIYNLTADRRFCVYMETMGTYTPETGLLSQKSVASGSVGGTPLMQYTRTYWANWAGSYVSSTQPTPYIEFPGDYGDRLNQGVHLSKKYGNRRSLFGLPYATIQSDLTGATINKITVTFRVASTIGLAELRFNSHNHTTKPSTFNPANVDNDIAIWPDQREGSTYTKTLANSVGDQLKAGTKRGFGFGPAPVLGSSNTYYAQVYGVGSSRPRVTITYTK